MSLTPVALPRKQSFIKSSSQTTQIGSSSCKFMLVYPIFLCLVVLATVNLYP